VRSGIVRIDAQGGARKLIGLGAAAVAREQSDKIVVGPVGAAIGRDDRGQDLNRALDVVPRERVANCCGRRIVRVGHLFRVPRGREH
jgi:hypothetical protein